MCLRTHTHTHTHIHCTKHKCRYSTITDLLLYICHASEKPRHHELDQLLSDIQPLLGSQSGSSTGCNAGQTIAANRFPKPATAAEIKKAQESCVPANTKKATSWCLNVWKAWRDYRKTANQIFQLT